MEMMKQAAIDKIDAMNEQELMRVAVIQGRIIETLRKLFPMEYS